MVSACRHHTARCPHSASYLRDIRLAAGPEGYIAVFFRHPLLLIVLAAYAIAAASTALAREVEHRTILILLARPLERYHLVLSRGMASLSGLALLVVALLAGTLVGVVLKGLGDSVDALPFLIAGVNALCLAAAIVAYSYLFSALSNDGGRAILLSTGLTLAFFFLDYISVLVDVLEPVGLLSVFHYYDPLALTLDASFPVLHVGLLLAVAAAAFGTAVVVFQRRDIAV